MFGILSADESQYASRDFRVAAIELGNTFSTVKDRFISPTFRVVHFGIFFRTHHSNKLIGIMVNISTAIKVNSVDAPKKVSSASFHGNSAVCAYEVIFSSLYEICAIPAF